jgi:multidrug efflux pump subunit AcrA (membrane-fusion protein)
MKKTIRNLAIWIPVLAGLGFIGFSFARSRPVKHVAAAPKPADTPVRVYGRIEPSGQEVYVTSPVSRAVTRVLASEGELVKKGQPLCSLESSVELAQLAASEARVGAIERTLALSRDSYERNHALFTAKGLSEYEYTQSRLKKELDEANLEAAQRDADLIQAQLDQLVLRVPQSGRVYKFDVRLGQTLTAGDNTRVILGSPNLAARLYVEAFWASRVKSGLRCRISDVETGELVGSGPVTAIAPYLGKRSFRAEDPQERLDTDYQEVVVTLDSLARPTPVGLKVLAELGTP